MDKSKTCRRHNQSTLPETLAQAHEEILALREQVERSGRKCVKTLARFAHDTSNLLTGPMGYLDLAQKSVQDLTTAKHLRMAKSTMNEALGMVQDINLRIAHDQRRLAAMRHVFDLGECVQSVIDAYAPLAEDKRLQLYRHIGQECPDHLIGDATFFKRILSNLVSNAVKYTRQGSVGVMVSYRDGRLTVKVIDTGIGISEEDQTRIFRTFERAATDTHAAEGFGIGLSVVAELIRLLDGEIEVQSRSGGGSTFAVQLPFSPAEEK